MRARAQAKLWGCVTGVRVMARRPEIVVLGVVVLVGLGLRLYFVEAWRPALVGFPDSAVYVNDAIGGIFDGPLRVGGYSEFLRLMHALRPHLSFAIVVQHVLGLASGLLLFGAVRRAGVSAWAALLPAMVVILGGSELFIEHAPLTEATFILCADLALYALVRAWTDARAWAWAVIAGAALGVATDLRSVGLLLLPVLVAVASLASPSRWARRGLCAALALIVAAVPIEAYLYLHRQSQGYGGFTGAGYFDLYGRVAPFADCTKFTPPAATAKLCIHIPPSQRPGHDVWEFTGLSPAVQAYGEPDLTAAKPTENSELRAFGEAAILGQPGRYVQYVARDLVRVVDPSFPSSPYGAAGPTGTGYGNTPESLLAYYFNPGPSATIQHVLTAYYPGDGTVHRDVTFVAGYERHTRIQGPVMVILLLLAVAAPLLTSGRQRRAGLLFGAATVVLLAGPIFVSEYDYRFTIPAFGPLAATAAIGAWGAAVRLRPHTAPSQHASHASTTGPERTLSDVPPPL